MAEEARQITPFTRFGGVSTDKDFNAVTERVDHRHPATGERPEGVPAPELEVEDQRPAPDAEPMPTPATPTPHPDGPRPMDQASTSANSAALSPDTIVSVPQRPSSSTTGGVVGLPDEL